MIDRIDMIFLLSIFVFQKMFSFTKCMPKTYILPLFITFHHKNILF